MLTPEHICSLHFNKIQFAAADTLGSGPLYPHMLIAWPAIN